MKNTSENQAIVDEIRTAVEADEAAEKVDKILGRKPTTEPTKERKTTSSPGGYYFV